jgi:hypothetical protein
VRDNKETIKVTICNINFSHLATTRNCSTLLSGILFGSHTSVAGWDTTSLTSVRVGVGWREGEEREREKREREGERERKRESEC